MSKETTDTLGNQKRTNYALRPTMTRDEFIKEVTAGLTTPPAYFPLNVMLNKQGYESIGDVLQRRKHAMSPDEFETAANETDAVVLDTRDAAEFAKGFVPNSINIGIDGSFAPWVGALIPDIRQHILLVTDQGREEEVITRLARVGYDYTIGYLDGGIEAWKKSGKEIDHVISIPADEFASQLKKGKGTVLDVRRPTEFEGEHVKGAENMPLDNINDHLTDLDKNKTYYVHCAGGYRSMIFNSILRARGYHNLVDVEGGIKAIKNTGEVDVIKN